MRIHTVISEALYLSKVEIAVLWVCENNSMHGTAVDRASAVSTIQQKGRIWKGVRSVDGMT
jgi:hypothetical protein